MPTLVACEKCSTDKQYHTSEISSCGRLARKTPRHQTRRGTTDKNGHLSRASFVKYLTLRCEAGGDLAGFLELLPTRGCPGPRWQDLESSSKLFLQGLGTRNEPLLLLLMLDAGLGGGLKVKIALVDSMGVRILVSALHFSAGLALDCLAYPGSCLPWFFTRLHLCFCTCIPVLLCLSVCVYAWMSIYVYVANVCVCMFCLMHTCLSVCMHVHIIRMYIIIYVYLSLSNLSIYLPACLSVCLSIRDMYVA